MSYRYMFTLPLGVFMQTQRPGLLPRKTSENNTEYLVELTAEQYMI